MTNPENKSFELSSESATLLSEFSDMEGVEISDLISEAIGTFSMISSIVAENNDKGVESTFVILMQSMNEGLEIDVIDVLTEPPLTTPDLEVFDPFTEMQKLQLPSLDNDSYHIASQLAVFYGVPVATILTSALTFHWHYCEQERNGLGMLVSSYDKENYYQLTL